MKQVPTQWQNTKLIDGYPGKYCVLARQAMDGKWYVAVMNAEKKAKSLTLDLNLLNGTTASAQLPEGKAARGQWQMVSDGADGKTPALSSVTADKKGLVKLTVGPQSGIVLF